MTAVQPEGLPRHVAIIMDGNGRWAQQRGLSRVQGHRKGKESVREITEAARELGIEVLTLYAFSTENWRRPVDEVRFLMGFNESLLKRRRDELHAEGVRITFSGRRDWRVPRRVLKNMEEAEELTKRNKVMTLNMAFNYGGRAEIVDAVRQLVEDGVRAEKIDEKTFFTTNPPNNEFCNWEHIIDREGFVTFTGNTYDYGKIKTDAYYIAHKMKTKNIDYLMNLVIDSMMD